MFAHPRRVCLKHIHDPKEEQWKQACNRHESTKRIRGVHPFQNVSHIPAKICSQAGRFHVKTRFQEHISNCPNGQKIENLFSLLLEGCALPIHLPPFRSLFFGQNFHQSNEVSCCNSKSHGDQINYFSRRLTDHSGNPPSQQGNTEGSHKDHSPPRATCILQKVTLSQGTINNLQWGIDSACLNNGRDIIPPPVDTMIFCDASKIGWGAQLDLILIGGGWLKKEASSHINFLELKAAFLAFQALVPSVKGPTSVLT